VILKTCYFGTLVTRSYNAKIARLIVVATVKIQ
jgi:hypothetical protein